MIILAEYAALRQVAVVESGGSYEERYPDGGGDAHHDQREHNREQRVLRFEFLLQERRSDGAGALYGERHEYVGGDEAQKVACRVDEAAAKVVAVDYVDQVDVAALVVVELVRHVVQPGQRILAGANERLALRVDEARLVYVVLDVELECVLEKVRHQIEAVGEGQTQHVNAGRLGAVVFAQQWHKRAQVAQQAAYDYADR